MYNLYIEPKKSSEILICLSPPPYPKAELGDTPPLVADPPSKSLPLPPSGGSLVYLA